MAISATHYALLKELHSQGVLPQGGRILEIGQANWYGDLSVDVVREDIRAHAARDYYDEGSDIRDLLQEVDRCERDPAYGMFRIVRLAYLALFRCSYVASIDLDPDSPASHRLDLTHPIDLGSQFNVVYNHGTMEHPSQDLETQETMHRHCKVGGLLIHEAPYNQPEHGQRSYSLNFFTGMARANGYEIVCSALEHMESKTYWHVKSPAEIQELHRRRQLQHDLMLFVSMRKTTDAPYVSRWMQDVYSGECEAGRVLLVR